MPNIWCYQSNSVTKYKKTVKNPLSLFIWMLKSLEFHLLLKLLLHYPILQDLVGHCLMGNWPWWDTVLKMVQKFWDALFYNVFYNT